MTTLNLLYGRDGMRSQHSPISGRGKGQSLLSRELPLIMLTYHDSLQGHRQ
jgi:hypothetical protein